MLNEIYPVKELKNASFKNSGINLKNGESY